MPRKKKSSICPLNNRGCTYDNGESIEVCCFWMVRKGCKLELLIHDLRSLPNLLRHIENHLEAGDHLPK